MPAANDHLAAALVLTGASGSTVLDFTGADYTESGSPDEATWWGGPHKSLWFSWTCPADGDYTFRLTSGAPAVWDVAVAPDAADFTAWVAETAVWAWQDSPDTCLITATAGSVWLGFADDVSYEGGASPATAATLEWAPYTPPPPPPPPYWAVGTQSPEFQQYGFFAEVGGALFYGSSSGPSVWAYDPTTDIWTDPVPCSAYDPGSGSAQLNVQNAQGTVDPSGDSIWILGNWQVGLAPSRQMGLVRWYPATDTHDAFLYSTLGYDSTFGERLLLSPYEHTLVITATHIYYLYPSLTGNPGFDQRWTHSVLMIYDRSAGTWSTSAPLPYSFIGGGSAVTDGAKIYVTGLIMDSSPDARDGDMWIYDIATDSWAQGADPPVKTKHTDAVYAAGQVWVLGGDTSTWTSHAQIYDPAADTWSTVDDVVSGGASGTLRTLLSSHKIYVTNLGGSLNSGIYWHSLAAALTTVRRRQQAASVGSAPRRRQVASRAGSLRRGPGAPS